MIWFLFTVFVFVIATILLVEYRCHRSPVPSVLNVKDFNNLPLRAKAFLAQQELEGKLDWKAYDCWFFVIAEMTFNNVTVKVINYPLSRTFVRL